MFSFKLPSIPSLVGNVKERFTLHAAEDEEEEEELVDPLDTLREKCKANHCPQYLEKFNACEKRVNSKKKTAENCWEELMDLMHCVDHCAAKDLFNHLK